MSVKTLYIKKLAEQEQKNLQDRERVILEHLPQIRFIAQRIAMRLPPEVQLEDLVSAGVIGLLDAYNKFDPSKGVSFKTYASVRIRGAILDSLRDLDWAPRDLRSRSREVERAYALVEQRLGRPARDEEVAQELGMELREFQGLLDQLNGLTIGHFRTSDEESEGVDVDNLPVWYSPISPEETPFEAVSRGEMRRLLAEAIETLPEREQLILSLYYREELTMKEIGHILGVNESRISQLHTRAVLRLRSRLQAKLNPKQS
ncbi:MAG TPA: FliA/WhiG family RNA polymerase sigma factor [Acidobacteriota bacterium]|nr:FliA/WhiG family RNA polymerase sigma factor [Acidobacteriota bacterium]